MVAKHLDKILWFVNGQLIHGFYWLITWLYLRRKSEFDIMLYSGCSERDNLLKMSQADSTPRDKSITCVMSRDNCEQDEEEREHGDVGNEVIREGDDQGGVQKPHQRQGQLQPGKMTSEPG